MTFCLLQASGLSVFGQHIGDPDRGARLRVQKGRSNPDQGGNIPPFLP